MQPSQRTCPCDMQVHGQERNESLPQHTYQMLPTKKHMRLLLLEPGRIGEPLCGSLTTLALDDADDTYVALSYTWDGQTPKHAIDCDGRKLTITCNLFSVLSRVRSESASLLVYADAICINQAIDHDALDERASQVRLMGDIFTKATKVTINLGEDPGHLDTIFNSMNSLAMLTDERWDEVVKDPENVEAIGFLHPTSPAWPTIVSILRSHWFTRIWTVQEYVLAREANFLIGRREFPSFIFATALKRHGHRLEKRLIKSTWTAEQFSEIDKFAAIGPGYSFLKKVQELRDERRSKDGRKGQVTLAATLLATESFHASDSRDKVYGLLGLVTGDDMSAFAIDYVESVEDLSVRLSRFLIEQGDIDNFLAHLACKRAGECPSWSMDLRHRPSGADLFERQIYNAGGRPENYRHDFLGTACLSLEVCLKDTLRVLTVPLDAVTEPPKLYDDSLQWILDSFTTISELLSERGSNSADHLAQPFRDWTDLVLENLEHNHHVDLFLDMIVEYKNTDPAMRADWTRQYIHHVDGFRLVGHFILMSCLNSSLGFTDSGRICKVPGTARVGDCIAVVCGVKTPLVMRRTGEGIDGDGYKLIGDAYLQGVMQGEALAAPRTTVKLY